jgi:oligopeptide/dipeptide ABC transporter ATP-binding protein
VSTPSVLLDVRDLRVAFETRAGLLQAVDGVSFTVQPGSVLGIVGESGCGKSVTAHALMGLHRTGRGIIRSGSVELRGRDLLALSERELREIRGTQMAMVFQDPMTCLNPVQRIGTQIAEMLVLHTDLSKRAIHRRCGELLGEVGIPNPTQRLDDYPHQFSGGMRQRAMIAMALACEPSILIADEPTTALDVTIQAQIIDLLDRLRETHGSAIILITHDLGVVADIADEILVMYAGRAVEQASKRDAFADPLHPYTWGLLSSIPRVDRPRPTRLPSITGAPPSPIDLPAGCTFRPRCAYAFEKCSVEPALEARVAGSGHRDRCWLSLEEKRQHQPGARSRPIATGPST